MRETEDHSVMEMETPKEGGLMEVKRKTCCEEQAVSSVHQCQVFEEDKDRGSTTGFGKKEVGHWRP